MSALHPCPSCSRHVRVLESACPFCGGALPTDVPARMLPTQRLGRAATFAFGAAIAASSAGCGTSTTPDADGGHDAYVGSFDAAYGAPDVGQDAAPAIDAGTDAAFVGMYGGPPPNDADFPDAFSSALYGAPPAPPEPHP